MTNAKEIDALIKAITRNDLPYVEREIARGLDVNAQCSNGRLPLMMALSVASMPHGYRNLAPDEALPRGTPNDSLVKMVHLLLGAGADIGRKNGDGRPVIDSASEPTLLLMIVDRALASTGGDLKKAAKLLKVSPAPLAKAVERAKQLAALGPRWNGPGPV